MTTTWILIVLSVKIITFALPFSASDGSKARIYAREEVEVRTDNSSEVKVDGNAEVKGN